MNNKKKKRRRKLSKVFILLCLSFLVILGCVLVFTLKSCGNKEDKITIAVDAGHDASQPGFTGIISEYEYTSKMSTVLAEKLKEDKNYKVILTHQIDEDMPIAGRVDNVKDADIILTIHASSSSDTNASNMHIISKPSTLKGYSQSRKVTEKIAEKLENSTACYAYYEPVNDTEFGVKYVDITDETKYDYETMELMEAVDIPVVEIDGMYVTSQSDVDTYMSDEKMNEVADKIVEALKEVYGK